MAKHNATVDRIQAVWNKLGGELGVDRLLRGELEVVKKRHIIDLDADPFVPYGWKVKEHRQGGQFKWNPAKVSLYLSEGQKGRTVQGHKLWQELQGKPTFNANLLDYWLEHPELIPYERKGTFVFFWGTIYRNSGGDLHVRCLHWYGGKWCWYSYCLDYDWDDVSPAAVFAS